MAELPNKDTLLTVSDLQETVADKLPDTEMSCLTYTRSSTDVCGIAHLAEAPERAHGVDALTIGAQVWHNLTFINICGPKQNRQQNQVEVNINLRLKLVRTKKFKELTRDN